eukprot:401243_1
MVSIIHLLRLIAPLIGIIIFIFIFIVHYINHFQCKCCSNSSNNQPTDTKFNFFPMSFLLYVSFNLLLSIFIVIVTFPNNIYTDQLNILPHQILDISIFIFMYGIMILSIWLDFFAYYRYYTTFKTTKHLMTASTISVLKNYTIYVLIFCSLFIIQLHFYHLLFAAIITLHVICNLYCNYQFTSILIKQYHFFEENSETQSEIDMERRILNKLYFIRKLSLIHSLLNIISLSLFLITYFFQTQNMYSINIIAYIPFLWSISSAVYAITFVRNRKYLKQKCFCTCCMVQSKPISDTQEMQTVQSIK